jgi:DNA-binding GntR family transcriptional regulator
MDTFRFPKPTALTDWAYSSIKQSILTLQVRPGAQLRVEQLAKQMRISRTPIREALLRLEQDGLVRSVARVGFFAASFTKRELKELYEIRAILESTAAAEAASRLDDNTLAQIDRLVDEADRAVAEKNVDGFLAAEIAFHRSITDCAINRQLVNMIESLRDLTFRGRILSLSSLDNLRLSVHEHRRIAEALHRGDSDAAGKSMKEHLTAARDRMLQFVDLPEEPVASPDQHS